MKVIKLDDGELGLLLPDDIVTELGLKEGDDVELLKGSDGTLVIKRPDHVTDVGDEAGTT